MLKGRQMEAAICDKIKEFIENFEKLGKSKFSKKNFAKISFGNGNYAKFSINNTGCSIRTLFDLL